MNMVLITISVFLIAFAGMAIGVMISGRRIKGSCGGIGAIMGESGCDSCAMKDKCATTGKEICEEGDDCDTTAC